MVDGGGGDVGVAGGSGWLGKWPKNVGNRPKKHAGSRACAGQ